MLFIVKNIFNDNRNFEFPFRTRPLLPFLLFNVGLPTVDVVTDLINFFTLYPDHPYWAFITLTWMFTSFSVHATLFFITAIWIDKTKRTCQDFYAEVAIHFPGVATFHNLWMAKKLYQLKYGTREFEMTDRTDVEKILDVAGRYSHGESMYEAGPQSVTQVNYHNMNISHIKDLISAGDSLQYWPVELFPAFLHPHLPCISLLGSFQV